MNSINEVITRRTNSYNRAVAKNERAEKACGIYERANEGFLSYKLLDKVDKTQTAVSRTYAAMVAAERMT